MTTEDGTLFGEEGGGSVRVGLQVAEDADDLTEMLDGG